MVGLIATTWRGGSAWLYRRFRDTYPETQVHHEAPAGVMYVKPGINVGWPIARDLPLYRKDFGDIPLVHFVRDPVAVAISGLRQGFVETVEDGLECWVAIHERILNECGPSYLRLKAEDVWADTTKLYEIAHFLGLPQREKLAGQDKRTGASIKEMTVPAFEIPSRVQVLAEYFGYEVPDEMPEMTFKHGVVARDKLQVEMLTQVV